MKKRTFRIGHMNPTKEAADRQRIRATRAAQTQEAMQGLAPHILIKHYDPLRALVFVALYMHIGGIPEKLLQVDIDRAADIFHELFALWRDSLPSQVPGYPYTFEETQQALEAQLWAIR